MILKIYNNAKSWNAKTANVQSQESDSALAIYKLNCAIKQGAYMATLEEDSGFLKMRFTSQGGKYVFLDRDCLADVNMLTKHILEANSYKGHATCTLIDGEEGIPVLRSQGSKVTAIKLTPEDYNLLSKIESFVLKEGFEGIESILFSPRTAGRYKSVCLSPSKTEKYMARITVDMH